MSKSIQEQMADALAKKSGEDPVVVLERMETREKVRRSVLATMLEEVKARKEEAGAVKGQAKAAKTVAKKTTEDNDMRPIVLLMSEEQQMAYISINKRYRNKSEEDMLEISKKYLKTKKKLQPLLDAPDLIVQDITEGTMLQVVQAEARKVELHRDLEEMGYDVLSPLPKNTDAEIADEV